MRCNTTVALIVLTSCLAMAAPLPAHAVPIQMDLTISFVPNPPPVIPSDASYECKDAGNGTGQFRHRWRRLYCVWALYGA